MGKILVCGFSLELSNPHLLLLLVQSVNAGMGIVQDRYFLFRVIGAYAELDTASGFLVD